MVFETFLRRVDPRWKILLAMAMSVAVSVTRDLRGSLWLLVYGLILALAAWLPLKTVLLRLVAVNGLLISLWFTLPFTTGGATVLIGPLPLSVEGLVLSAVITLKSSAMVLGLMALLGTSPLHKVLRGMGQLGVPVKLVMLLHFCSRYIHVIREEKRRIQEAATLRGFRPILSRMGIWAVASLVGSLLVKSHDRSVRVHDALVLRGFDGTFPSIQDDSGTAAVDMALFGAIVVIFGGGLLI